MKQLQEKQLYIKRLKRYLKKQQQNQLWEKVKEETGSATVEASIWVPTIFFAVLLLITLALQWMEMGIVQGEMLITSSNSIQYVNLEKMEPKYVETRNPKIHFIKEADWKISNGKKEWKGQFRGNTNITGTRRTIVRKVIARKEHPIRIIRRQKRLEEAISG